MTLEAMQQQGWPLAGIAARLRKHHVEIPNLSAYLQGIADIARMGIQVIPITGLLVEGATRLCRQYELLIGDGLIVAVMRQQGLTQLASSDTDFDRVPGLTRYAPV